MAVYTIYEEKTLDLSPCISNYWYKLSMSQWMSWYALNIDISCQTGYSDSLELSVQYCYWQ